MPVVAAVFGLAAAVWGVIVARRGSLLAGCGLVLIVGYVLGHDFWNVRVGPLPVTFDRLLLIGLFAAFVVRWRFGYFSFRSMTGTDWVLVVLLALLTTSALFSGQPEFTDGVTSKWGRLMASFLLPAVVYAIVRQIPITQRQWTHLLFALTGLGVYLAVTAAFEVAGWWSLVFPHYIADPNLGIHFGRARGPELNAVSLGLYLTVCATCAWLALPQARRRWQQLALLIALPLMAAGVFFTYTRPTWIGFATSGLVIAGFQMPRRWRVPALVGSVVAGTLLAIVSWSHLMGIHREGTVEDSEHSVAQRESFAYVSWKMFRDHPVLGVGFGRFFDQKLPYLSDRSQQIELESIRPLHHHNTFLSVLTETGIVGVAAFIAVFIAWGRAAWGLATNTSAMPWVRAQGVLMLALVANFWSSALFHDLTLLPPQEMMLFLFAGLTVNLRQSAAIGTAPAVANAAQLSSEAAQYDRRATIQLGA
jgi:O-antigen ligase